MSETTFDVIKENDKKRLEYLRKKGINAPDYTYDETASIQDISAIASKDSVLVEDNKNAIIADVVKEIDKKADNDKTGSSKLEIVDIQTGEEPGKDEKGEISGER